MAKKSQSLMRAFGLVAGDLWKVFTGKRPETREKKILRRDVREQEIDTPQGTVILRRTTTDEVELRRTR
jgi:hypothetical protein